MNINDLCNYVTKITELKFTSKADAEKQLGVTLHKADNPNNNVSFYEFKGELPLFKGSTEADLRIHNDVKNKWFVLIEFNPDQCIDMKTVKEKFPNGIPSPPDPSNLSPDAEFTYEINVNSGTLIFGFNFKSGCFTGMSFNHMKSAEKEPAKKSSSLEPAKFQNTNVVSSPASSATTGPHSFFAANNMASANKMNNQALNKTNQPLANSVVTEADKEAMQELKRLQELLKK